MITKEQINHAMGAALFDSMASDSEDFGRGFEDGAKWAIDQLQPEIDALKSENKRLRSGLKSILHIEARDAIEELKEIYKIIEALNP
jgi:cell division protein FtsB